MIDLKKYPATVLSAAHRERFLLNGELMQFSQHGPREDDTGFLESLVRVRVMTDSLGNFDYHSIYLRDEEGQCVLTRKRMMMLIAECKYIVQ